MSETAISKAQAQEAVTQHQITAHYTTGFHQITIDEYLLTKHEIEVRLRNIADNYVAIGFCLRQIMDSEAYRQEGYTSINEFAKKEYSLSESAVSRFIAINIKFSAGGYSDKLLPEYKNYGSSKLSEMLTLSDDDCRLIVESTTVATIRELKKFNKEAEEHTNRDTEYTGEAAEDETAETVEAEVLATKPADYNDLEKVIIEFFRNEKELLTEIYQMSDYESIADRINPSGSRSFRKAIYMLFMYGYGEGLILKKMGEENKNYTWQQFIETTVDIYKAAYTDHGTVWENFYRPEPETEQTENTATETTGAENTDTENAATESAKTEITKTKQSAKAEHAPTYIQDAGKEYNKEEKAEAPAGSKTEGYKTKEEKTEPESSNTAKNEDNGRTGALAALQENSILSVKRWYIANRHISLDMGVKQEIADRLCIRTTPEVLKQITEFIEAVAAGYAAYVYKNMGGRKNE